MLDGLNSTNTITRNKELEIKAWIMDGHINILSEEVNTLSYKLIDTTGRLIRNGIINPGKTLIPTDNFSGIVFLSINDAKNNVKTIKLHSFRS